MAATLVHPTVILSSVILTPPNCSPYHHSYSLLLLSIHSSDLFTHPCLIKTQKIFLLPLWWSPNSGSALQSPWEPDSNCLSSLISHSHPIVPSAPASLKFFQFLKTPCTFSFPGLCTSRSFCLGYSPPHPLLWVTLSHPTGVSETSLPPRSVPWPSHLVFLLWAHHVILPSQHLHPFGGVL